MNFLALSIDFSVKRKSVISRRNIVIVIVMFRMIYIFAVKVRIYDALRI